MTTSEIVACVKCKYCVDPQKGYVCSHPQSLMVDVVTGKSVFYYCNVARSGSGPCSPAAKLFEARDD